jgi:hypothetical protein
MTPTEWEGIGLTLAVLISLAMLAIGIRHVRNNELTADVTRFLVKKHTGFELRPERRSRRKVHNMSKRKTKLKINKALDEAERAICRLLVEHAEGQLNEKQKERILVFAHAVNDLKFKLISERVFSQPQELSVFTSGKEDKSWVPSELDAGAEEDGEKK